MGYQVYAWQDGVKDKRVSTAKTGEQQEAEMIDKLFNLLFDLVEIILPAVLIVLFIVMMMRPVHGV